MMAITAADGAYQISDLPIRTLRIDAIDGAAWGISPRTAVLTQSLVITGQDLPSVPAVGQIFGATGSIAGRVAVDTDDSGEIEAFELFNVPGVRFDVYLDDGDGIFEPLVNDPLVTSATSDAAGLLNVPALAVGGYWLRLDESSGGMLGYSLFGRQSARRAVVAAQTPVGNTKFAVLQADTVTTLADEIPGSNTPANLSLREALDFVRIDGKETSVVLFHPSLGGGTIDLDPAVGQLLLLDGVSIVGPDSPITIRSSGLSRVMSISSGVSVTLQNLALIGGVAATGGAVSVGFGATLVGNRVSVSGNAATQRGGAIYASSGSTVTLNDSTLAGNSATLQGGAIYASAEAIVELLGTTLSGNSVSSTTSGDGGAVYSLGTLSAVQATLSGNTAARRGGAIIVAGGEADLLNSTIAVNHAGIGGGGIEIAGDATALLINTIAAGNLRGTLADDVAGTPDPLSHHNLIGTGASGLTHGSNGNTGVTTGSPRGGGRRRPEASHSAIRRW